jgi:hypothetical protein
MRDEYVDWLVQRWLNPARTTTCLVRDKSPCDGSGRCIFGPFLTLWSRFRAGVGRQFSVCGSIDSALVSFSTRYFSLCGAAKSGCQRVQWPRGGRSSEGEACAVERGGSSRCRLTEASASLRTALASRHHSSDTTGLRSEGAWEGAGRLEQCGPEHGRPGVGAQGEGLGIFWPFEWPILKMSRESAAALDHSSALPEWLHPLARALDDRTTQRATEVRNLSSQRSAGCLEGRWLMKLCQKGWLRNGSAMRSELQQYQSILKTRCVNNFPAPSSNQPQG